MTGQEKCDLLLQVTA